MPTIPRLRDFQADLTEIRRDIHAHPELAYKEDRTSAVVAAKLSEYGCEVHRGLGGTGVVGTLRRGNSPRAIGLRADMDALPIEEKNTFAHVSKHVGQMHACGHDGHTTILLGAARYLAETRNFEGAVHFIFQPAEEGGAGGKRMVEEGLFEKFPCDVVFAMHNKPGIPLGHMGVKAGPMLASSDTFEIKVKGRGGHAAHPHLSIDPFVIGAQIVLALQTISSRNVDPLDSVVVSIGRMQAGTTSNVIPDDLSILGTVRAFRPEVQDLAERRIGEIAKGIAATFGAVGELTYTRKYPPTINDPVQSDFAAEVAVEVCGAEKVALNVKPSMGAEDFSFMLRARPGAMVWLGNGSADGGRVLHNARYDFNDEAIPTGVSFFVRLAERYLEAGH